MKRIFPFFLAGILLLSFSAFSSETSGPDQVSSTESSTVQRQEKTRKDTVEMVTQAILVLESQGYNIKIKDLISVTGLSRSVFAKPHIREVLVEYGIIQTQTPEKTAGAESTRRMDRLIAEKNGYIQDRKSVV